MLSATLPFVPFTIPPRKEWKPGQEKKPRLDLKKFEKKFRKEPMLLSLGGPLCCVFETPAHKIAIEPALQLFGTNGI